MLLLLDRSHILKYSYFRVQNRKYSQVGECMKLVPNLEWNNDIVGKFWDFWCQFPEYYFTYNFGGIIAKKLKKYIKETEKVLDFGCGNGYLIQHLLKNGLVTAGVDFSPKSISSVNAKYSSQKNFLGAFGINELKQKGLKFDTIISIEVIEHLDDKYLSSTVDMMKSIINKNGIIIFTTPNEEALEDSMVYCPISEKVYHRWQHVRSWSGSSLRAELEKRGLSIQKTFTTDYSADISKGVFSWMIFLTKKMLGKKLPHLVCIAQVR